MNSPVFWGQVKAEDSLKTYLQEEYHRFSVIDFKCIVQAVYVADSVKNYPQGKLPDTCRTAGLVFLEIDHDPIARIKRGKLYKANGTQPLNLITDNKNFSNLKRDGFDSGHTVQCRHFSSYYPSREGFDLRELTFYFGNSELESRWKVLHVDFVSTNEELYCEHYINSESFPIITTFKSVMGFDK